LPELANNVQQMARQRSQEAVGRLLSEAAQSDANGSLPAFAPESVEATARFFIDFVVMPMITRALQGEKLESLRAEIKSHIAATVPFFLAGCQHGGVG
jgi:hypothetical protein